MVTLCGSQPLSPCKIRNRGNSSPTAPGKTRVERFIMKFFASVCSLFFFCCGTAFAETKTPAPNAEIVSFHSGATRLGGYLFRPETPGKHPVMIWNHGSPVPVLQFGSVSRFDDVARFFLQRDFILFIPDRRARTIAFADATDPAEGDQEAAATVKASIKEALEQNHSDFIAAKEWIKNQPYADPENIFAGGYSAGALQCLYEASVGSHVRGFVLFTPGSKQWTTSPLLQDMMLTGAKMSTAPIFIAQAQNDGRLEAIAAIGKVLAKKGPPNATIVYPPHGKTQKEANGFALTGVAAWSRDVGPFLDTILKD